MNILTAPKEDVETHLPGQPKPEDYSEYYKTLVNPDKLQDAVLLKLTYGVDFL